MPPLNPHCTLKHTSLLYMKQGTYIKSLEFAQDRNGSIVGLMGKVSGQDDVCNIFSKGNIVSALPLYEEELGYVARLEQWVDSMDTREKTTKTRFYFSNEDIGILMIAQGADNNLVGVTGIAVLDPDDHSKDFPYFRKWVHNLDLEGHGLDDNGDVPEGFVGELAKWDITTDKYGALTKIPFSQLIMGTYYFVPDKRPVAGF